VDSVLEYVLWVDALSQVSRDGFQSCAVGQLVMLYAVDLEGERKPQHNSRKEHFNAQDEILVACGYCASLDVVIGRDQATFLNDRQNET